MMGAGRASPGATMGASRPATGESRFAAPAQRAGTPAAYAGHSAAPAAGRFGNAATHAGAAHFAGAQAHAGMAGLHAESHAGPAAGAMHGEAGHGAAGRGDPGHTAGREGGREGIARDDPARAHGRFDEHVRNPERERDIVRMHEHDFHVRDVRYFNDHEWGRWRGGYWHRDFYDGRFGWWFDVGGVYYPYAAPIWPYPLYVAPLIAAEAVELAAAPPPVVPIAPLPALPRVAYHCASPAGFYPEVEACDAGWITLAAH